MTDNMMKNIFKKNKNKTTNQDERAIKQYEIAGDILTVRFYKGSLTNLIVKDKTIEELDIKVRETMEKEVTENTKKLDNYIIPIDLSFAMIALMIFPSFLLKISLLWILIPAALLGINRIHGYILKYKINKSNLILNNLRRINEELATNKALQSNLSFKLVRELKKSKYANIYNEKDLVFSYNGAKKANYQVLKDLLQTIENIKLLPENTEVKVKKRGDIQH